MSAQQQSVNFLENEIDQEIELLGRAGWHAHAIAATVNMSKSQVQYRLTLAGVRLKDYRNGKNEMSKKIVEIVRARNSVKETVPIAKGLPLLFDEFHAEADAAAIEKRKEKNKLAKISSSRRKPKKTGSN